MVKLSVSVMAHPVRRPLVEELLAQLGDVPVSWDSNPEPSPEPQRRWATGRRAFELADPQSDWHVVVQDDALVSENFREGLARALDHAPFGVIVSPYLGTKRPSQQSVQRAIQKAEKAGSSWTTMSGLNWGVAIAVPTVSIPHMLAWCDEQTTMPYDTRIGRFYRDQLGWECWYTWPSLVDHREGPSICGHSSSGRYAHRFAGDAMEPDWSRLPPEDAGQSRAFRNIASGRLVVTRDPVAAAQMASARRWVEEDATALPLHVRPLR